MWYYCMECKEVHSDVLCEKAKVLLSKKLDEVRAMEAGPLNALWERS